MGWPDLAAALLRVYAAALSASGYAQAAGPMLTHAAALEHRPESDAHVSALQAAGYVTHTGQLTREGRAALAQVLDERGQA